MLTDLDLHKILFLDIETVPLYPNFEDAPEVEQRYFEEKTAYQRKENFSPQEFYNRAGIWAEFGKIVCISVGYFGPQKKCTRKRRRVLHSSNRYRRNGRGKREKG